MEVEDWRPPGTRSLEQPAAPYLEAVVAYATRGSTRFHVPGHKGGAGADPGLRAAIGWAALTADIPQDIEGIDLGPEPTPYQRAELLAAEAHGAARTFFLTNGATQGNHALCLALAPLGAPVVVQRNSHASVIDGLVLSGGHPTFVAPEYEDELGMAHGVTPESLERALAATGEARAAFIVSPTYYGMAADVAGCADVCHAAGVALVVDQAWGPHFGFHPELPASALALGADAVLTSTHKIVGSLTQSAMLHVSASEQIDAIDGVAVVGADMVGRPGVAGWDPLRIVVDVRGTGCTGYEVAAALRNSYDIHVELATHATMVLVLGLDEPAGALERFAHDFAQTVRRIERPGEQPALVRGAGWFDNEVVVPPREAFLGTADAVAVDEAPGHVSAEAIAGYPPGIPALLPGERITAELVTYLRELRDAGARLHGASDPSFETICVLRATD